MDDDELEQPDDGLDPEDASSEDPDDEEGPHELDPREREDI